MVEEGIAQKVSHNQRGSWQISKLTNVQIDEKILQTDKQTRRQREVARKPLV